VVLLDALPDHCTTGARWTGSPEHLDGWSQTDLLLGNVFDAVQNGTHVLIQVNSEKPSKDLPESIIPTGAPARAPEKVVSPRDLSAFFGADPEHGIKVK